MRVFLSSGQSWDPMSMRTLMLPLAVAALAMTMAAAPVLAAERAADPAGDPAAGKKVTEFLCRNCHDVSGSERPKSPPGGAPAFFDLAQSPDTTTASIRKLLRLPHGRMTNVHLTDKEINDAAAYIISFRRK